MNNTNIFGLVKSLAIFGVIALLTLPIVNALNKQTRSENARFYDPGLAAYQQGHYAEAEKDLKRYLRIYPDSSNPLYNLGLCQLAEGKKAEAYSSFQASAANGGQKMGHAMCGDRRCEDLSGEMMAWMNQNPTWDASQSASVPSFPAHRELGPKKLA